LPRSLSRPRRSCRGRRCRPSAAWSAAPPRPPSCTPSARARVPARRVCTWPRARASPRYARALPDWPRLRVGVRSEGTRRAGSEGTRRAGSEGTRRARSKGIKVPPWNQGWRSKYPPSLLCRGLRAVGTRHAPPGRAPPRSRARVPMHNERARWGTVRASPPRLAQTPRGCARRLPRDCALGLLSLGDARRAARRDKCLEVGLVLRSHPGSEGTRRAGTRHGSIRALWTLPDTPLPSAHL
jgi:hypothetical protein